MRTTCERNSDPHSPMCLRANGDPLHTAWLRTGPMLLAGNSRLVLGSMKNDDMRSWLKLKIVRCFVQKICANLCERENFYLKKLVKQIN